MRIGQRAPRPAPLDVSVVDVERKPGSFVSIQFGGPAIAEFEWPGAGSHLKVIFPNEENVRRGPSRTYTPRRFDAEQRVVEVDFLLHGDGLASSWAERAEVGDRVQISKPRASYRVDEAANRVVLAGDDSAVPAIATILDGHPGLVAEVFIETSSDPSNRPQLPGGELAFVEWITADPGAPGVELDGALRRRGGPTADTSVWVACEAVAVRRIRSYYLNEVGHPRERLVTRGYWRVGESNHPDHDFGED